MHGDCVVVWVTMVWVFKRENINEHDKEKKLWHLILVEELVQKFKQVIYTKHILWLWIYGNQKQLFI